MKDLELRDELEDVWAVIKPVGQRAAQVRSALLALGLAPERLLLTTPADPGAELARRARAGGAARVVVAGGDGTLRSVAGELADSGVVIGLVPTGTANVAARNLGISTVLLRSAVRRALSGAGNRIDLGVVRLDEGPAQPFVVMAGMGNDARSIAAISADTKLHLGWLSYFEAGVRQLVRRGVPMRVDNGPLRETWSVLAANCGLVPPGATVAPGARPDDGLLHVLTVRLRSAWDWGPIALAGFSHWRGRVPGIERQATESLVVTAAEPCPVQADGDLLGEATTLRLEIRPGALRIA